MAEEKNINRGKERRKARRVYASFVEYCRVEDTAKKKFQAFTENISATGICIFANEEIKANTLLSITIYLLDETNPIETTGKVAWIRPSIFLNDIHDKIHFDIGVEFVDIAKEDRERLQYYASIHPLEA